jgi:hypothetical protein
MNPEGTNQNIYFHSKNREGRIQEALAALDTLVTDYAETFDTPEYGTVGIDEELKRPIAVLHAAGVNTEASCWGHPEHRDRDDLPPASRNVLPYIECSGYTLGDGEDDDGNAIGYSSDQVDRASAKASTDYRMLMRLYNKCFDGVQEQERLVTIRYPFEGCPGFKIQPTMNSDDFDDLSVGEQDSLVEIIRKQMKMFFKYVEEMYVRGIV